MSNINRVMAVFLWLVGWVLLCSSYVYAAPSAKVTARVVDESGAAIQGADVTAGYTLAKKGGFGTDDYREKGKSDKDGLFTATGETIIPQVTIHAQYEGYYRSSKWAKFTSSSEITNRWEPWNPTVEVVLKKKRNPAPMYMNNTNWTTIPNGGAPIGYDLEKGDWVAPYGIGLAGDLLIEFRSDYKAYRDYESKLTITFSNENDGIQEFIFTANEQSSFKWPFEAPENGYMKKIEKFKSDRPGNGIQTNVKNDLNYIFRVRTKTDKAGNIIEAKYGKITGDFEVGRKPQLGITYSFNPDGTRNLEEDPEKNLFEKK